MGTQRWFRVVRSAIPVKTKVEIIKLLISKGADKNLKDKSGKTALQIAEGVSVLQEKQPEVIEALKIS